MLHNRPELIIVWINISILQHLHRADEASSVGTSCVVPSDRMSFHLRHLNKILQVPPQILSLVLSNIHSLIIQSSTKLEFTCRYQINKDCVLCLWLIIALYTGYLQTMQLCFVLYLKSEQIKFSTTAVGMCCNSSSIAFFFCFDSSWEQKLLLEET